MDKKSSRLRRARRSRAKIRELAVHRLSIHRTPRHIYAQVIDDWQGHTLASASTLDPEIKSIVNGKKKAAKSELVGSLVAKRALIKGINQVAFDRGGYKYHGRVKALAEAARQGGLKF